MAQRGGRRQGTSGQGYSNRTDLLTNRAPSAPPTPSAPVAAQAQSWTTPDEVPRLDDPSARPDEPLTTGLNFGPGAGPDAIGPMPQNPNISTIAAAYAANPTPELRRAMMFLHTQPDGF